jgi:hypothetical protein
MKRQAAWAAALGKGFGVRDIAAAAMTLRAIRQRLDSGTDNEGDD